jgi:glucose-6-phosphate isomerase, archaeal
MRRAVFEPGLDIEILQDPLGFRFGCGVFGPDPELRSLDAIRPSLLDPACSGPDPVYAIAMDVGRLEHREELRRRMLLFGVVAYAAGRLGQEPVRSQGHVHKIAPHSQWSPPELFEIWKGHAVIYMQEFTRDHPGRCVAIQAGPGDRVVVPPAWAHAVISADPGQGLVFGAWCDREYGFAYDAVRARGGLAWFPIISRSGELLWQPNPRYRTSQIETRDARAYPEFGLLESVPLYAHLLRRPDGVQWVSEPSLFGHLWPEFEP